MAGETYMITQWIWITDRNFGDRILIPIQVPLRKWYWRDGEGQVRFSLRVRNRKLELKKGTTDIYVGDDNKVPSVIEKCISAVEAGELDDGIAGMVV